MIENWLFCYFFLFSNNLKITCQSSVNIFQYFFKNANFAQHTTSAIFWRAYWFILRFFALLWWGMRFFASYCKDYFECDFFNFSKIPLLQKKWHDTQKRSVRIIITCRKTEQSRFMSYRIHYFDMWQLQLYLQRNKQKPSWFMVCLSLCPQTPLASA